MELLLRQDGKPPLQPAVIPEMARCACCRADAPPASYWTITPAEGPLRHVVHLRYVVCTRCQMAIRYGGSRWEAVGTADIVPFVPPRFPEEK